MLNILKQWTNRLLHAIEEKSQYYGLNLNKAKCIIISSNGRHNVRFKDGIHMLHKDKISYLGGLITRQINIRIKIDSRISVTMAIWKYIHIFFKNVIYPVRWKLIVYNNIIRAKFLYGLEIVELTNLLLCRLENFQLRGLKNIL